MTQPKSKIFLVYYMIFCISVVGIGVYLASVLDTDLFGANPPALQNEFMYLFFIAQHKKLRHVFIGFSDFAISPVIRFWRFRFSNRNVVSDSRT